MCDIGNAYLNADESVIAYEAEVKHTSGKCLGKTKLIPSSFYPPS